MTNRAIALLTVHTRQHRSPCAVHICMRRAYLHAPRAAGGRLRARSTQAIDKVLTDVARKYGVVYKTDYVPPEVIAFFNGLGLFLARSRYLVFPFLYKVSNYSPNGVYKLSDGWLTTTEWMGSRAHKPLS